MIQYAPNPVMGYIHPLRHCQCGARPGAIPALAFPVFNPHTATCLELKRFASFYKNIPADLPAQCQLPYNISLPDGTTIHAPAGWTNGSGQGSVAVNHI